MGIDQERVKLLGELHHQFFDSAIKHNITKVEWDDFFSRIHEVYLTLGIKQGRFIIDENGCHWKDSIETPIQDKQWSGFLRDLDNELTDITEEWIELMGDKDWDHYMKFLDKRTEDLLEEIKIYCKIHYPTDGGHSEVEVEVSEEDREHEREMSEMMSQFESLPLPSVDNEVEKKHEWYDDVSVEDIIKMLYDDYDDQKSTGDTTDDTTGDTDHRESDINTSPDGDPQ